MLTREKKGETMATFYIPDSTGWAEDHNGGTKLRFAISTEYDRENNRSTVTLMPQVMIASSGYRLVYNMRDNSSLTANGNTLIAATGSGSGTNGLSFDLTSTGWKNIRGVNGYAFTVDHNAQGLATVTVNQAIRLLSVAYQGNQYSMSWAGKAGSYSWSETPYITYTLILSAGTGSTVTVTKGGVTLQNGASVQEGDVLTVNFGAAAGYVLETHTVNGETVESGSTVTVGGNVTVAATASAISYTLSISAGTGTEVTVQRISSPKQGAALGALTDGAALYDGDVLRASAEAATGYALTSATLNGKPIPENHTVSGDVSVTATAQEYVDPTTRFVLTISTGTGAGATVIRQNEKLISGAIIAAGDVLSVYFSADAGYVLDSQTVNGSPFISGGTVTVSGDVAVAVTAAEDTKIPVTIGDLWHDKPTFFQWESDRVLVVSGTDKTPYLRFANCALSRALVVKAEYAAGEWRCSVPNILLQYAGDMVVSVVTEEETGETRELASAVYRVKPRVKPQDYEYTENIGYINWVAKSEEAEKLLQQMRIDVEANSQAEAWAVGTRNGVPVGADDETFQNNAQFYADVSRQQALTGGFIFFRIDENGNLIFIRTTDVPYRFRLENGDLIVEVVNNE